MYNHDFLRPRVALLSASLVEQKPGGMCQYKVRLSEPSEVDKELVGWIKQAYDGAI